MHINIYEMASFRLGNMITFYLLGLAQTRIEKKDSLIESMKNRPGIHMPSAIFPNVLRYMMCASACTRPRFHLSAILHSITDRQRVSTHPSVLDIAASQPSMPDCAAGSEQAQRTCAAGQVGQLYVWGLLRWLLLPAAPVRWLEGSAALALLYGRPCFIAVSGPSAAAGAPGPALPIQAPPRSPGRTLGFPPPSVLLRPVLQGEPAGPAVHILYWKASQKHRPR